MDVGAPITVEKIDENGDWAVYASLHCLKINQTRSSEYAEAGSEHSAAFVDFTVRWSKRVEEIRFNTSQHRIVYRGRAFNVTGYDDYMERRATVRLTGVSYDG